MINAKQFREIIIQPVLDFLGSKSIEEENCLVMTMAHESKGCTYITQLDGGPAFGPYQMQKGTFNDLFRYINESNPRAVNKLCGFCNYITKPFAEDMQHDLRLATYMACWYYMCRAPKEIPANLKLLAQYVKQYWNTPEGKATPGEYYLDYCIFEGITP